MVVDWEDAETLNGWHSAAEIKKWKMPLVRSVGVEIEVTDEMVVLAGDYSSPGDELNRLTRIRLQWSGQCGRWRKSPIWVSEKQKPSPVLAQRNSPLFSPCIR